MTRPRWVRPPELTREGLPKHAHDLAALVLLLVPALAAGRLYGAGARTMRDDPLVLVLGALLVGAWLVLLFTGPRGTRGWELVDCPHCGRLFSVQVTPSGQIAQPGARTDPAESAGG